MANACQCGFGVFDRASYNSQRDAAMRKTFGKGFFLRTFHVKAQEARLIKQVSYSLKFLYRKSRLLSPGTAHILFSHAKLVPHSSICRSSDEIVPELGLNRGEKQGHAPCLHMQQVIAPISAFACILQSC